MGAYIIILKYLPTYLVLLNDALHDQLVFGLCQDSKQRKLLAKDKLAFKKVCERAQAIEVAERNTCNCELKVGQSREEHAVSNKHKSVKNKTFSTPNQPLGQRGKKSCYCCGGHQHKVKFCRFQTEKCQKCDKVGHIASYEILLQRDNPPSRRATRYLTS